jgi:hypothetical protein
MTGPPSKFNFLGGWFFSAALADPVKKIAIMNV